MSWINVGATQDGMPFLTKKALLSELREGNRVRFYSTSSLGPGPAEGYTVVLQEGDKLSVVGPDPYRNRKWYATVEVVNGKVRAS